MSRIDRFLDALLVAFNRAGDIVPWPLHLGEVLPYCGDLEAVELNERLGSIGDAADVASLFASSSSPKTLLMDLTIGLKVAGIPTDERVAFAERIFDAMEVVDESDIFCRDGKHLNWAPARVEREISSATWIAPDEKPTVEAIFKLSAQAQSLVWSLFFYGWTDVGFVTTGPYRVDVPGIGPAALIVRDNIDLRPSDLWPNAESNPIGRARILTLHEPDEDFQLDVFNHLSHSRPLRSTLRGIAIDVDGENRSDLTTLQDLSVELRTALRGQQDTIRSMDRTDLLRRFLESRYYALRRWRTTFGLDWRPPSEVYERVASWPPIVIEDSAKQDIGQLRRAADPRTDDLP